MIQIGIIKESVAGEKRVALIPDVVSRLVKQGFEVLVEKGAGASSYYVDNAYSDAGATIVASAKKVLAQADVVAKVLPPTLKEVELLKEGAVLFGIMYPHKSAEVVAKLNEKKITCFSMELVPRITRAQAMDVLSSQATVTGYKSALLAANMTGRFLPMLTTAAGTIRPSKVLILGAGVAGLQAIATARRLGAIVEAYDVRRAAGEQVQSLGAKFLALEIDAEGEGGYARELTAEEKQEEQEMVKKHVGMADAVITTAQIPGRTAPQLVSTEMVEGMKPGSVVIDLAAETGGNCELTKLGKKVEHNGVIIYGPEHFASELPVHASEMYSKNLFNFMGLLSTDGKEITLDWEDEILTGSVLTHDGEIKSEMVK